MLLIKYNENVLKPTAYTLHNCFQFTFRVLTSNVKKNYHPIRSGVRLQFKCLSQYHPSELDSAAVQALYPHIIIHLRELIVLSQTKYYNELCHTDVISIN
jgi:hypothetical protein